VNPRFWEQCLQTFQIGPGIGCCVGDSLARLLAVGPKPTQLLKTEQRKI
jgi:hypothetical protein